MVLSAWTAIAVVEDVCRGCIGAVLSGNCLSQPIATKPVSAKPNAVDQRRHEGPLRCRGRCALGVLRMQDGARGSIAAFGKEYEGLLIPDVGRRAVSIGIFRLIALGRGAGRSANISTVITLRLKKAVSAALAFGDPGTRRNSLYDMFPGATHSPWATYPPG